MKIKNILLTLCTSLLLTNVAAHAKEVKIGMAIDDLRLERSARKYLYSLQMAMKKHKCRRLKT